MLGANDNLYGVAASGGTNGSGTVFSIRLGPSPSIVAQPASFTNFAGTAAIFTVAAIGAPPLHYCWQRSATNLTDGGNISGSATSTLTLTNLALTDSAGYSVIVTNAYGAGTSAVATLTVINPFPPAVTTLDATAVGINGATLNASVNPDGATTTAWFVWGITTNYGNSTTVTNVGDGGDVVSVSLDLGGLQSFTEYHFAAVAGNSLGTNTGADLSFITPGALSNIVFTPLLSFDGTNGGDAHCGLMQAVDGNFYGTTYDGGDYDLGTVYQMTTRGVINILFSFDGTNGSHPEAGLVRAPIASSTAPLTTAVSMTRRAAATAPYSRSPPMASLPTCFRSTAPMALIQPPLCCSARMASFTARLTAAALTTSPTAVTARSSRSLPMASLRLSSRSPAPTALIQQPDSYSPATAISTAQPPTAARTTWTPAATAPSSG